MRSVTLLHGPLWNVITVYYYRYLTVGLIFFKFRNNGGERDKANEFLTPQTNISLYWRSVLFIIVLLVDVNRHNTQIDLFEFTNVNYF